MDDTKDMQVLSCGCVAKRQRFELVFIPCKATCVNFRNLLSEALDQHKPIEFRPAP